jgi:hypothetical protein
VVYSSAATGMVSFALIFYGTVTSHVTIGFGGFR